MPDWETYKTEAQDRGALAFELFVVTSTPAANPEEIKANLPAHLAYQKALEENGTLVFAGPLSDESGTQMEGMGLIVYRTDSFESAQEIALKDPMHASGARSFVLRKWMINEGSLTVSVGLSTRKVMLE